MWMFCALLLVLYAFPASAARTTSADQPVTLRLELNQPTVIAFPESVESTSVGYPKEQLSINSDGAYLFLLAVDPSIKGRLFVVGQSGKLYTVLFQMVERGDDVVHLTTQAALTKQPPTPLGPGSILRLLRTQLLPPGAQPAEVALPLANDPRVMLTEGQTLQIGGYIGQSVLVQNTQQEPLSLDIRVGMPPEPGATQGITLSAWIWPPRMTLKALATGTEVLGSGEQTQLWLVYEERK